MSDFLQNFKQKREEQKTQAQVHYEKWNCAHEETVVRVKPMSNGLPMYVRQCIKCGDKKGNAISKDIAIKETQGKLIPFDDEIQNHYKSAKDADAPASFEKRRDDFFSEYDVYLASDAWKQKRQKVLARAGNVCEGCRDALPTEVHHLSYEHVGDELLFQLVALCHSCHQKIHAH